jgi:hypothetical protein
MAIPEQIRKQSEAVSKLYEDLNPDSTASADEGNTAYTTSTADSANVIATTSAPTEQRQAETTQEDLTYEQRWRSLQGMYNSETTSLKAENNQLGQRVGQLEQLLTSLSTPQQQSAAQTRVDKLITDKDVEDYGDSIDVMRRAAREEVASANQQVADLRDMVMQLQANVVPKVDGVMQRQALNAEQVFWTELSSYVPDWREINANQGFHDWLLDIDPLSGLNRQTYLDTAQNQLNAQRVAGFFKTWQSLNSVPVALSPRSVAASQLEKQIAPGRGRAASAVVNNNDTKSYTRADVAKFFDDVRKGMYKGREQERDRIERDIFASQREGRIT